MVCILEESKSKVWPFRLSEIKIKESIVLYTIFKTSGTLFVSDNLEIVIKSLFENLIPIIGFIGGLYLILRRSAGLWLIGIWSSLLIFPIFFSYNENGYILSKSYFNFFNTSPLFHAFSIKSESMIDLVGTDYRYNFGFIVKYSPFTSGIGVNFIPILYLLAILLILLQNLKIMTGKKILIFLIVIAISTCLPYAVYSSVKSFHSKKIANFELKKMKLQTSLKQKINEQNSLYNNCYEFSRLWFNADDNQLIREISCYNNEEKVRFTK